MQSGPKKLNLNWGAVEKALAEGTFSGYKIGIIETEKLFSGFLSKKKIPGRSVSNKIRYVRQFMSQAEQLRFARAIYKKIIEAPDCNISKEETQQAIRGYWQAMLDLDEAIAALSSFQKYKLRFKYFSKKILEKIRTIAISAAAMIGVAAFFYETGAGLKTALTIGQGVHFLIFKIGPWIIGIIVAFLLFGIGMKVLQKKKEF